MEQPVVKADKRHDKKWRKILRILQVMVVTVLLAGEIFGFTLSIVFYKMDQGAFWQWISMMVLFGLPMAAFVAAAQLGIRRRSTEYEYQIQDKTFLIDRIVCNRRKWYLTFEFGSVVMVRPYSSVAADPDMRRILKRSIVACCNINSQDLLCVQTNHCLFRRGYRRAVLLLEPGEEICGVLKRECRGVWRP